MKTTFHRMNRRSFLSLGAVAAGTVALAPAALAGERSWSGRQPVRYPDPDIVVLNERFEQYRVSTTSIERLWTGALWNEGCAWCGGGRYLVWSDIPNNRQMRRLHEDGHVSEFRKPSHYSNGNTFDFEGRQLSCEQGTRRVVRYEHSGAVTVLADRWNSKPLNSPNDIVVHPDGGVWFTDPVYGILGYYEGHKAKSEIKPALYRIDPKNGTMTMVSDEAHEPNGLCFSPDYKNFYLVDTGVRPSNIFVYDVVDGKKIANKKLFCTMDLNGRAGASDGIRADTDGNIWSAAGWAGAGYDGVHVFAPDGQRIGMILLPEVCANLCFGGPRRNRLFMAASQSLYAVFVNAKGAHIC